MTKTLTTVVCSECRHDNEPERVYCHDCGARLDRSAVNVRKEPVADTQKRVKKLFDPQRAKIRALFFAISKVVLGACGLAAVIQMALPPDAPASGKTEMLASQLRFDLEGMTARHQPPQALYSEDQVNAFLGYALKAKQSSLNKPFIDFKRAFVRFTEGKCVFIAERSLFGFSVYTGELYAPSVEGGKIVVQNKGGSIGRLPIHPQVSRFMSLLFVDLWSALDREIKLAAKLGGVEFHDKNVLLIASQ